MSMPRPMQKLQEKSAWLSMLWVTARKSAPLGKALADQAVAVRASAALHRRVRLATVDTAHLERERPPTRPSGP